ncbi:MAG: universal stress protein [Gaiellales bacterium]
MARVALDSAGTPVAAGLHQARTEVEPSNPGVETILVAIDRPNSVSPLPYAARLAASSGARLVLVHVTEVVRLGRGVAVAPLHVDEDIIQHQLRGVARDLCAEDIQATLVIRQAQAGRVARAIVSVARSHAADLVVVGSHSRAPITSELTGAVAQTLLELAPCPVIAAPLEAAPRSIQPTEPPPPRDRPWSARLLTALGTFR